jgi:hypothetical protein
MPFKKGKSGNPRGRPKGKSISAILRDMIQQLPSGQRKGKTYGETAAHVILREALKGDAAFMKMLLDRSEGQALQHIEIDAEKKAKPRIRIPHDDARSKPRKTN